MFKETWFDVLLTINEREGVSKINMHEILLCYYYANALHKEGGMPAHLFCFWHMEIQSKTSSAVEILTFYSSPFQFRCIIYAIH